MTVAYSSLSVTRFHGNTSQNFVSYDALCWRYESAKRKWIAGNPASTPTEYEAAIRRIARELGV